MKKSILALICTVAVIASGVTFFSVFAQPGSSDDPIVTKSYIDSVLAGMSSAPSYKLISMNDSQQLVCSQGAEFIIRQGGGTVFSGPNGGLADVTAGADIPNGGEIPANHLIVVPVSDWRGFTAVGDVLVLVRGEAQVIN